jgi:hypothetical protein
MTMYPFPLLLSKDRLFVHFYDLFNKRKKSLPHFLFLQLCIPSIREGDEPFSLSFLSTIAHFPCTSTLAHFHPLTGSPEQKRRPRNRRKKWSKAMPKHPSVLIPSLSIIPCPHFFLEREREGVLTQHHPFFSFPSSLSPSLIHPPPPSPPRFVVIGYLLFFYFCVLCVCLCFGGWVSLNGR